MKVYPDLMAVMRRGRMFHSPKCTKFPLMDYVMAVAAFLILTVFFSSCSREAFASTTGIIPSADVNSVANILYAEAASDPEGWIPKLNTYYRAKRRSETILAAMKRVSSAYRMRSKQYRKVTSGQMNSYERKIFNRLLAEVKAFQPDPDWECVHHENLDLYADRRAAIAHLRRAWGDCVDFGNPIKIGKEHYFKRVRRDGRVS